MHDGVSPQTLPIVAVLAFETFLVFLPVVLSGAAFRTDNALFLTYLFPFRLAALLARELLDKF